MAFLGLNKGGEEERGSCRDTVYTLMYDVLHCGCVHTSTASGTSRICCFIKYISLAGLCSRRPLQDVISIWWKHAVRAASYKGPDRGETVNHTETNPLIFTASLATYYDIISGRYTEKARLNFVLFLLGLTSVFAFLCVCICFLMCIVNVIIIIIIFHLVIIFLSVHL